MRAACDRRREYPPQLEFGGGVTHSMGIICQSRFTNLFRGWLRFPPTRWSSAWHRRNTAGISVTRSFHSAEILDMRLQQLHKIDYTANLHPDGGWFSSTQRGNNMNVETSER